MPTPSTMVLSWIRAAVAAGMTLGVCAAIPVGAQSASEPALKAAFLVNFTRFTEWPAEAVPAAAALVVCTTDRDVAVAIEGTSSTRANDPRPLAVRRVTLDEPLRQCAVLHVGRIDRKQTARLVTGLQNASVLTVGDSEEFAERGGMIGLFIDGDRMRFAINPSAAERAGLRLSARLLSLARLVKGDAW